MAFRKALKELQLKKKRFFLVKWACDQTVTAVEEKHFRSTESIEEGTVHQVKYAGKYLEATVVSIGTEEEIKKAEEEYEEPEQQSRSQKRKRDKGDKENEPKSKKKKCTSKGEPKQPKAPTGTILLVTKAPTPTKEPAKTTTPPAKTTTPPAKITTPPAKTTTPANSDLSSTISSISPNPTIRTPSPFRIPTAIDNWYDNIDADRSIVYSEDSQTTTESVHLLQARMDISILAERVTSLEEKMTGMLSTVIAQQEEILRLLTPKNVQPPTWNTQQHPVVRSNVSLTPLTPHRPATVEMMPATMTQKQPHFPSSRLTQTPLMQPSSFTPQTPHRPDTAEMMLGSSLPLPLRGSDKAKINALPSSSIDRESLEPVNRVLQRNRKMQIESKAPTLAWRLARDCYFGEEVMKQCTPNGCRDRPALPRDELYQLKQQIFTLFPKYMSAPESFEKLWGECITSIEQGSKRLRKAVITPIDIN